MNRDKKLKVFTGSPGMIEFENEKNTTKIKINMPRFTTDNHDDTYLVIIFPEISE